MKQNTKQPLYKVLNEQRTQGEWIQGNNTASKEWMQLFSGNKAVLEVNTINCKGQREATDFTTENANAAYTALAVNNLHHLAEALEGALKTINTLAGELNYQSTRWDNEHIKPIEEALARIS